MIPLDYLSAARFHGTEAGDFLQTQLSADISVLKTSDAGFACYCSPRGQVIGLLLVCRREDDFVVVGSSELLPGILKRLKMFVMRAKVEFSLEPELQVYGSLSVPQEAAAEWYQPANLGLYYRISEGGLGAAPQHFKAEELRRRVAWLAGSTSEKFIPQMLGYDQIGAVSFSKGCYPGQEIVARARYLGKVKRKPAVIEVTEKTAISAAERVELLRDNTWSPGTVIDSSEHPEGSVLFVVASAEPESPVTELKHQERTYRCATT